MDKFVSSQLNYEIFRENFVNQKLSTSVHFQRVMQGIAKWPFEDTPHLSISLGFLEIDDAISIIRLNILTDKSKI